MALETLTPRTTSDWRLSGAGTASVTPEQLFLDAVIRLNDYRFGRVAAHIHLSRLSDHNRKPHYLRLAADMFDGHIRKFEGQRFELAGHDIVFIGRDMGMAELIKAVDRLRLLFAEDPLAQYGADGTGGAFATYYDVENDYDRLRQNALNLHKAARRALKSTAGREESEGRHGRPFVPSDLAKLIAILERADLAAILRRQTACLLRDDGLPEPLFEEHFVSLDDLQQICAPHIDLLSDRWLFHYLTLTLDQRVLAQKLADGVRGDRPFSLNLNVATLLSPEFRRFDAMVPPELRRRSVIEIHKNDVFGDIGAYIFARDFLHDRGYLLCLDGLTHHTLPFFDRNRLGLDLFKIYWAPEGLNAAHPSSYPEIRDLVAQYGATRIVLCRCESEDALKAGRDLGVIQYQGRFIDRLLNIAKGKK